MFKSWGSRESERTSKTYCCAAMPRRTRRISLRPPQMPQRMEPLLFQKLRITKNPSLAAERKLARAPTAQHIPCICKPGNVANCLQQVNTGHSPSCGSFKSFQHHRSASDLIMWSDWLRQSSFSRHNGRVDAIFKCLLGYVINVCDNVVFPGPNFRIYKTSDKVLKKS